MELSAPVTTVSFQQRVRARGSCRSSGVVFRRVACVAIGRIRNRAMCGVSFGFRILHALGMSHGS